MLDICKSLISLLNTLKLTSCLYVTLAVTKSNYLNVQLSYYISVI